MENLCINNDKRLVRGTVLDSQNREAMETDVLIVGGGPAGLAAAIKLRQDALRENRELAVCVVEKGCEIGMHALSGAVLDPSALQKLIPDWKEKGAPLNCPVTKDSLQILTKKKAIPFPQFLMPPLMHNKGNHIISLGAFCRWLATQAEELGVEIYAGFAAVEVLFDDKGAVRGIATGDMGVTRQGEKKPNYEPGVEIHSKYTLFAEGARGSLTQALRERFKLEDHSDVAKYGIGLKETWEVDPKNHQQGSVRHTMGWPLKNDTGGGSFIYHGSDNKVTIGFVVHLNYTNPYLSPFDELQRFKTHPSVKKILEGAKRLSYGARVITEGGYQSIPKLAFPGGALIGCAAGFVNVPRIKGIHNAMESGRLAATAITAALKENRRHDTLTMYEDAFKKSRIFKELKKVRNVKPLWSRFGTMLGVVMGGIDMWMNTLGLGLPITLKHGKADHETLKKAKDCQPIDYPKPDGTLMFDKPSSVFLSGTQHDDNEPVHLVLKDPALPIDVNLPHYDEPAQRYCPVGVYEVVEEDNGKGKRFQINAQNCIHCKTCDIKDPSNNIVWVAPQGGEGPNYSNM